MNPKINETFKALIPPLAPEEFAQLEKNCLKDGIIESLKIWNGFIIDGHNRLEIAQRHNLPFAEMEMLFDDEDAVKIWMIDNQKGRRNLTDGWKYELAQTKKAILVEKGRENMKLSEGRGVKGLSIVDKGYEPHNTQSEMAKDLGWSTGKVAMADKVWKEAKPEVKDKIKSGDVSINQAYTDIKKEEKKEKFEHKKNEFEKPITLNNTEQVIILGDCLNVLPTLDGGFDLLLTDPPYGMDFKSGWNAKERIRNDKVQDMMELIDEALCKAAPLLNDDAHFYIFGNIDYIHIMRPIIEKYFVLKNILIWDRGVIGMGDLKTYGDSYDIIYFGVQYNWRNLNGVRDRDVLKFNRVAPASMIHQTEKPVDLLEYLIKKSTNEGDNILDPFAGGGSTLVASKKTNRKCTGIELLDENYTLIKSRI